MWEVLSANNHSFRPIVLKIGISVLAHLIYKPTNNIQLHVVAGSAICLCLFNQDLLSKNVYNRKMPLYLNLKEINVIYNIKIE